MTGQNDPTKRMARKAGRIGTKAVAAAPAKPRFVSGVGDCPAADPVRRPDDKSTAIQSYTNTFPINDNLPLYKPVNRRHYSPQEKLQVAETRRLGACAKCRASHIKCRHNISVVATDQYEYGLAPQAHEMFALGLTTPSVKVNRIVHEQAAKQTIEAVDDKLVDSSELVENGATSRDEVKVAKPPSAKNVVTPRKPGPTKLAPVLSHQKNHMGFRQGQLKPFRFDEPRIRRPARIRCRNKVNKKGIRTGISKESSHHAKAMSSLSTSDLVSQQNPTATSSSYFPRQYAYTELGRSHVPEWKPRVGNAPQIMDKTGFLGETYQEARFTFGADFNDASSTTLSTWYFDRRPSASSDQDSLPAAIEKKPIFLGPSSSPQGPGTPATLPGFDNLSIKNSFHQSPLPDDPLLPSLEIKPVNEHDSSTKEFSFEDYLNDDHSNVWDDETAVSGSTKTLVSPTQIGEHTSPDANIKCPLFGKQDVLTSDCMDTYNVS